MLVHEFAGQRGITLLNGFEDAEMFLDGKLSVVADVDGSVHNAFHLATGVADGADDQLITAKPGDAHVKLGIGDDEAFITGAVMNGVVGVGELGEALHQIGVESLAGGQVGGGTFHSQAIFVNLVQLLQGDITDKVTAIGNDAEQMFMLQADCGLAHRGTASLVQTGQLVFGESFSGGMDSGNDVVLECTVNPFAKGIG